MLSAYRTFKCILYMIGLTSYMDQVYSCLA